MRGNVVQLLTSFSEETTWQKKKEFTKNLYPGFCRILVAGRLGSEWMLGFNITPVVPNFIDRWIKGV